MLQTSQFASPGIGVGCVAVSASSVDSPSVVLPSAAGSVWPIQPAMASVIPAAAVRSTVRLSVRSDRAIRRFLTAFLIINLVCYPKETNFDGSDRADLLVVVADGGWCCHHR